MNYMKQVSEMVGVKIGEEFTLKFNETVAKAKIEMKGLELFNDKTKSWHPNISWEHFLLNGSATIVKGGK